MFRLLAGLLVVSMLTLAGCSEPEQKKQIDDAAKTTGEAKKEMKMTPTEPL